MINQATFIINPHAGHTRSNEDWQKFHLPTLKIFFPDGDYRFTNHPDHATFLARQALKSGAYTIIAIGGDGTINEVVNGFFENNQPINPQATLGIIPSGSGGDFARTLGLKRTLVDAAKDLLNAKPKMIDVGLIKFSPSPIPSPLTPDPCPRHFINIAEAGLGGLVMQKVNAKNKKIPALLRYISGTIQGLRQYNDIVVKLTFDNQKPHYFKLTNLIIANGRFFGHGMCPAPFAEWDDGFFDVLVLENHSGFKFGRLLPSLYSTKRNPNCVKSFRCQQIALEVADPTKTLITEVDGEVCGTGDVTFQLKEKAMSILCPQSQKA